MDMDIKSTTRTDTSEKLARLAELESKVKEIQKGNRERVQRFISKQKQKGKVQVSALISKKAYEIINNFRDKSIKAGRQAETISSVIEHALLLLNNSLSDNNMDNTLDSVKDNININVDIKQDKTELKQLREQKANDNLDSITSTRQPFLSLQGEIEPPPDQQATQRSLEIEIAEMPDKQVDSAGFKTWLYSQILAMKHAGNGYIEIAERLNGAGVKTIRNKEFNAKSIEKFFNTYKTQG